MITIKHKSLFLFGILFSGVKKSVRTYARNGETETYLNGEPPKDENSLGNPVLNDITTIPKEAGIYAIHCVVNERVYVGSSNCLFERFEQHFSVLNALSRLSEEHIDLMWSVFLEFIDSHYRNNPNFYKDWYR